MAKEGMNFDKYIDNPSGGAAVITNRSMYKKMYTEKFDKILLREEGKIDYDIYKDDDTYYIHIKVPSEVIEKFYYDVIIQLSTTVPQKKASANLRAYMVRFFSNDPAFVYTFAHAFSKNDLFISDLKQKMSRQALRDVAKVRNPKDEIFYVKSLYFAYLTMERYDLFNRKVLDKNAKKYKARDLINNIMQAEEKVRLRQEAQEKLEKENKKKKEQEAREKNNNRNRDVKTPSSKVAKVSNVSKVSKITRTSKTTKTTKVTGMKHHS